MKFGICYYPEHWPEERWATDAQMMVDAGIEIVRIAEFAWAQIEPVMGEYDWSWLDRAIDLLGDFGLRVMLGTPTATPPIWLSKNYPDILRVDADGRKRNHGSRRHYCPNSSTYRQFSQEIVLLMAQRYGAHPHVFGWQIDNEFGGGHSARCYCDNCITAFQVWLKERYKEITNLNASWGTLFWSQTYADWDEIRLPDQSVDKPNPSQLLDFYRFSSDSYVAYQRLQIEEIRDHAPRHVVTTNFMGLYRDLDQFSLAEDLDFVSWDSYPTGNLDRWRKHLVLEHDEAENSESQFAYDVGDPYITAMAHALTRGLKGNPFWVMEQQAGAINWGDVNPGIRPGTTRLWTWHALAEGAETAVYFRWRSTLFAQEQYHSGLLKHDGTAGVGLGDLEWLSREQQQLTRLRSKPKNARVALLLDFNDLWAIEIQPHRRDYGYLKHLFVYYTACLKLGLEVDIIPADREIDGYDLILAPTMHIIGEELVDKLELYVENGGIILLGVRSGFKTVSNLVTDKPLPGLLRRLVGATVTEWQALPRKHGWTVVTNWSGLEAPAAYWVEVLLPDNTATTVLASYKSGPYAGQAAMTEHSVGSGKTIYLGWYPTEGQARAVVRHLVEYLGIEHIEELPHGIIAKQFGESTLLLNFTDLIQTVTVNGHVRNVSPRDVLFLESEPSLTQATLPTSE